MHLKMTPEEEYDQYLHLHQNFSEEYARVYKHVMDFYPQPQKFIREASPEIDSYIEQFWQNENSSHENEAFRKLVFFANNFKSFATHANSVFEQFKGLHGESGNYIKTVFKLKEKIPPGRNPEYTRLVPVLKKLISGFEQIKQKTDETANNLRQLQTEWGSLKQKMNPDKPSIRP